MFTQKIHFVVTEVFTYTCSHTIFITLHYPLDIWDVIMIDIRSYRELFLWKCAKYFVILIIEYKKKMSGSILLAVWFTAVEYTTFPYIIEDCLYFQTGNPNIFSLGFYDETHDRVC